MADCCPPLFEPDLTDEHARHLAAKLKALGDPARLRILSLVRERGEACNCHLTQPLGLSQPTVSHHLAVLHEAGLLERERRGRWIYYRVAEGQLEGLVAALVAPAATPG